MRGKDDEGGVREEEDRRGGRCGKGVLKEEEGRRGAPSIGAVRGSKRGSWLRAVAAWLVLPAAPTRLAAPSTKRWGF